MFARWACRAVTLSMDWKYDLCICTCIRVYMFVCVHVFVYVSMVCMQGRDIEHGLEVKFTNIYMYPRLFFLCTCIYIRVRCLRAGP